jgi:hypothetical protein
MPNARQHPRVSSDTDLDFAADMGPMRLHCPACHHGMLIRDVRAWAAERGIPLDTRLPALGHRARCSACGQLGCIAAMD